MSQLHHVWATNHRMTTLLAQRPLPVRRRDARPRRPVTLAAPLGSALCWGVALLILAAVLAGCAGPARQALPQVEDVRPALTRQLSGRTLAPIEGIWTRLDGDLELAILPAHADGPAGFPFGARVLGGRRTGATTERGAFALRAWGEQGYEAAFPTGEATALGAYVRVAGPDVLEVSLLRAGADAEAVLLVRTWPPIRISRAR